MPLPERFGARLLPPVAYIGLAALVVVAYAPVLRGGFVWDDVGHIAENLRLESWAGIRRYWSEPVGRYYRPLVFLSYAADHRVFGRAAAGYHATNVALHLLNVLLLAVAARRLGLAPAVVLTAALLFALHPVQTEAVAYVSGRTDLLMMSGALTASIVLLGEGPAWRRGILAALGAAVSVLSKETGYALALFIPWLAWNREKRGGDRLAAALPTLIALAMFLALRPVAVAHVGDAEMSWSSLAGAGKALLGYATLLAWPATLMVDRLTFLPTTAAGAAFGLAVLAAAGLLAVVGLRRRATSPWVAWSVAFYLPAANLVPLYPAIAKRALFTPEHNLYAPSAGIVVLAALVLDEVARRAGGRRVHAVALTALAALAARTALRGADWRDEESLFGSAVAAGSLSPRVHYDLGNALLGRGELSGARLAFESAVRLAPGDGQAWANLGVVRQRQGDLAAALEAGERAAALLPTDALVRENLGGLHLARGDLGAARAAFAEALRLDPERRRARIALQAIDARAAPP